LKRKNQRNFITESYAFLKNKNIPTIPQHTGVQGVPLPVLRGPGEIGIPRRFWFFWRTKEHPPFFEKKEPKKLLNMLLKTLGKLPSKKTLRDAAQRFFRLFDTNYNFLGKRSFPS